MKYKAVLNSDNLNLMKLFSYVNEELRDSERF